MQAQKYRFKTVQCDPLQVGKGIVDLVFFSSEKILVIPKIQLALKYESTEFLGIRTIEWVGFPEFGLGCESMGLDEFIDGHGKSFSICFFLSCSHVWSIIRVFHHFWGWCGKIQMVQMGVQIGVQSTWVQV